ncbi:Sphingomyelin synthase-related protein 1 [Balamuthia mandrillaris]
MGKKKRSVSNKERTATDTVTTATAVIKASEWSVSDVSKWLGMGGYGRYAEKFAKNNVDGEILLSLTEHDLREEPLALGVIGDIKRLSWTIQQLRAQDTGYTRHLPSEPRLLDAAVDGFASSSLPSQQRRRSLETDSSSPPLAKTRPRSRSIHPLLDEEGHQVEVGEEEGFAEVLKRWQREYGKLSKEGGVWWPFSSPTKTRASFLPVWHVDERFASALSRLVMSFLFLLFSAMATALTMTFVHERVPDPTSYPPLPDIILDNVPHMPVAFTLAEYTIFSLALIFFVTVLLHRFRMVILRRFCCITAMVFLLRCCTMFVTSLSVPGTHVKCDHHLSGIPEDQLTNGIEDKLRAAWAIFSGLGSIFCSSLYYTFFWLTRKMNRSLSEWSENMWRLYVQRTHRNAYHIQLLHPRIYRLKVEGPPHLLLGDEPIWHVLHPGGARALQYRRTDGLLHLHSSLPSLPQLGQLHGLSQRGREEQQGLLHAPFQLFGGGHAGRCA